MADSLKIQNLSLNESQHAPNGPPAANGRSAYIPPHLRGRNVNPGPTPALAPGPSPMDGAGPPGPTPAGAWGNAYVLTFFIAFFKHSFNLANIHQSSWPPSQQLQQLS